MNRRNIIKGAIGATAAGLVPVANTDRSVFGIEAEKLDILRRMVVLGFRAADQPSSIVLAIWSAENP